jgi:hypothetical protein
MGSISQDLPHLLLHAATMPLSTPLQPRLYVLFDVADQYLGHSHRL